MVILKILPTGDLQIIADRQAKQEKEKILKMPCDEALRYLLEEHLCNGWSLVPPEEIGALTSAPIISDDFTIEDDGHGVVNGNVWWFPNYQITSEIEEIFSNEGAIFQKS